MSAFTKDLPITLSILVFSIPIIYGTPGLNNFWTCITILAAAFILIELREYSQLSQSGKVKTLEDFINFRYRDNDTSQQQAERNTIANYDITNVYKRMNDVPKQLENKWCKVSYNGYSKFIICKDKKIVDGLQKKFIVVNCYNISTATAWLVLINNFNEQTTYKKLRDSLNRIAYLKESNIKVEENQIPESYVNHIQVIDVNNANENDLCKLPGINRIQAKKIIQFRERERAFSSCDDFFETMKIKEHFRKQMKYMLVVNPVEFTVKKKKVEHERVVDL